MIEKYHNTPNFILDNGVFCEEILALALENLRHKKGKYYSLIKEYILNYKKLDSGMKIKIKKFIILIQNYAKINGEKAASKSLEKCLDILGAALNKSIYIRLCSVCIIYSEKTIEKVFLKVFR